MIRFLLAIVCAMAALAVARGVQAVTGFDCDFAAGCGFGAWYLGFGHEWLDRRLLS